MVFYYDQKPQAPLSPIIQKKGGFLVPQKELKQRDSMLYNLFSDSSMEGDTLDVWSNTTSNNMTSLIFCSGLKNRLNVDITNRPRK